MRLSNWQQFGEVTEQNGPPERVGTEEKSSSCRDVRRAEGRPLKRPCLTVPVQKDPEVPSRGRPQPVVIAALGSRWSTSRRDILAGGGWCRLRQAPPARVDAMGPPTKPDPVPFPLPAKSSQGGSRATHFDGLGRVEETQREHTRGTGGERLSRFFGGRAGFGRSGQGAGGVENRFLGEPFRPQKCLENGVLSQAARQAIE